MFIYRVDTALYSYNMQSNQVNETGARICNQKSSNVYLGIGAYRAEGTGLELLTKNGIHGQSQTQKKYIFKLNETCEWIYDQKSSNGI